MSMSSHSPRRIDVCAQISQHEPLVVLLLAGAFIGGALGQLFVNYLPLVQVRRWGFTPTTVNLSVIEITLV